MAVVGAGVAGCLVAALLARQGCAVRVFDLGRGPGGRMSQRREKLVTSELDESSDRQDIEIRFDHGAPYFHLHDPVLRSLLLSELALEPNVIRKWDDGDHGVWDASRQCWDEQGVANGGKDSSIPLVAVPGANAICQHLLASSPLITTDFSVQVAEADWLITPSGSPAVPADNAEPSAGFENRSSSSNNINNNSSSSSGEEGSLKAPQWRLQSATGKPLGTFHGLAIAAAYRTMPVHLPELPELEEIRSGLASVAANPCFALMVAFDRPVNGIGRGRGSEGGGDRDIGSVRVENSDIIATLCRDSSKPGRRTGRRSHDGQGTGSAGDGSGASSESTAAAECWVAHSTSAYAARVLEGQPAGRPSQQLLDRVASDLWGEMRRVLAGMHSVQERMRTRRAAGAGDGSADVHAESLSAGESRTSGGPHHHHHSSSSSSVGPAQQPSSDPDPPLCEWSLPQPLFIKAHRWGGAFPVNLVVPPGRPYLESEACRVVACGDFCASADGSPIATAVAAAAAATTSTATAAAAAAAAAATTAASAAPRGVEGAVQSAFSAAGRLSQLLGLPGPKL